MSDDVQPIVSLIDEMIDLADEWNAKAHKVERKYYNDASALRDCADDLMALIHCPSCGDRVDLTHPRCSACLRKFHSGACGAEYEDGNYCYVCRKREVKHEAGT
jgi:hypothetical protein